MARTWTRTFVVTLVAIVLVWEVGPQVQAETGNPGGQQFHYFGAAEDGYDPDQPTNQVAVFETTPASSVAGVERDLKPRTKITNLDNQVQLKYYLQGAKTCIGGSPRIQLGVDCDGDGDRDWNAFGYVGDKPFGGLCPMDQWVFEDMTNTVAKWDLSQGGGSMTNTWDQVEIFINMQCPNHQIVTFHPISW